MQPRDPRAELLFRAAVIAGAVWLVTQVWEAFRYAMGDTPYGYAELKWVYVAQLIAFAVFLFSAVICLLLWFRSRPADGVSPRGASDFREP